ncbi:hypothetical protein ASL14_08380 [Paenibacillus sp. IHB B 3084]|uniref:ABC-three component system middle component 6 n=1 Tax=Paenibacillus TaxID=44249 RepID=UPI000722D858|nr:MULTISPECIES: ABC-three component system middle component 6 [Paenibacillus]ALP36181.1 hypothetical protein ASL14_08380 [Paenibacillus sp. IHB B 3084]
MLLPDNMHPDDSIYFNGAIVLRELQINPSQGLLDLYQNVKRKKKMSFPVYILCLDWLYLIEIAEINSEGEINLCS